MSCSSTFELPLSLKGRRHKVGYVPAKCLIDSGAGLTGLSQHFAENHWLSVDKLADAQVSVTCQNPSIPVFGHVLHNSPGKTL